jgi:nucleotide-binding universal stress UspA family protein
VAGSNAVGGSDAQAASAASKASDDIDDAERSELVQGPRVVVGVDDSPAGRQALSVALDEARMRQATLHAVHTWQFPFETAARSSGVPTGAEEMRGLAEQQLDDALVAAAVADVRVLRDVRCGSATAELMDASQGAELLVVGTRGRNRLSGLFLGSVSQYLAIHAPCPVLVVHAPAATSRPGTKARQPAVPTGPPPTGTGVLEEIPEDECLALLRGQEIGRLVVTHGGRILAFPVNYTVDGRTVAVRTDPGTKLEWATLGRVAFEVDDIDRASHEGWSVLVQGVGRDVTEGVDEWSERAIVHDPQPWAEGDKEHWIAIASPVITGRRLRASSAVSRTDVHPSND